MTIDSRPDPRPFGQVADPWQWEVYNPVLYALESIAGFNHDYDGPVSFWRGLTRGSDKTSMIARLVCWTIAFSKRRLTLSVAAGDKEQAGLIIEAIEAHKRLNPWLEGKVKVYRNKVYGAGGTLSILTSDAPTSFGRTDDVVICDEVTHWKKRDLFDVLWSGREKRPGSVFIIISNAGTRGSWQWDVHEKAKTDKTWDVYDAPGPLASWMSPEAVARMRKMLPRGLAKRVLDNKWIDPAEEADFLTRLEIEVCEALGRSLGLTYRTLGDRRGGTRYVASVDYGPRRDRTALSVLHFDPQSHLVIVDKLDIWQGSPEEPVQIEAVENWISETNRDFNRPELVCDPYQLEGTCQRFENSGQVVERFEARGGKANYEMAENLRSLVSSAKIAWYPGCGSLPVDGRLETLTDELLGLVLKVTPYGYRFDHTAAFHDDRAVSIGMGALHAVRMDPSGPGVPPVPVKKEEKAPLHKREKTWNDRGLWGTR